ncbi:patatin-like phospholipase family protein [Lutibacter sp. B1]|uniref:patatin-like phospholipase family protein n=1 Tax=Lutibacter sp. B1 TaxID=2725996 RepID=UPI0014563FB4|nr:patatin-like phospholipase family protein [Lutibacter sp. B1]NLP57788.1 patatin-like phospholipase family protein [Lutibacter sp. B1]
MESKIGLVLSGGGVKALAHVGLIQVLLENNIVPQIVSGTSGGALVSALYAAGYSTEEMIVFFKQTPLLKFSLYAVNKPGILDSDKYSLIFNKYFPDDSFESLKYPLTVTATNLLTGRLDYFEKGELIKPLIASSALPPVFSPIEINGSLYSDGGILNNFPIEPLMKRCDKIIGSFVNPIYAIDKSEINSSLKLLYRVYHIGLDANNIKKFKQCAYVFAPLGINKIGVLDTKSIDKAYALGYNYAKSELKKIIASLK